MDFGLASLLMLLGLHEVLWLYGGHRQILEPFNVLIDLVNGIFWSIIVGHLTLGFTVIVAVWSTAIVPFLPDAFVGGAFLDHLIAGITALGPSLSGLLRGYLAGQRPYTRLSSWTRNPRLPKKPTWCSTSDQQFIPYSTASR